MYPSYRTAFESLDGDQCKELVLALFDHAAGCNRQTLTPAPQMAYLFISSQMDRDSAKYAAKCAKNREIAEQREAKKREAAQGHGRTPSTTNVHERHQYKDKDKDNYKDKDNKDIPPIPPEGVSASDAGESQTVQTAHGAADAASHSTTPQGDAPHPPAPSAQDERFAAFWKAYPRKVGKDAARKAWAKRKPSEALLDAMLAAIALQKQSRQWLDEGGRYIPHPSTWLNEGRWQDEPEPPPNTPPPQAGTNPFLRADL